MANLHRAKLYEANLERAIFYKADLSEADLHRANLHGADLRGANLQGADIDFSCLPLWCGGLGMKIDRRKFTQLLYHICSMECDDKECIDVRNNLLDLANEFHHTGCDVLEKIV
jgi:hypothetical protein